MDDSDFVVKRKAPSLVDLSVQTVVDNIRYLGDVGETADHLLERILPHCSMEQLLHVENSTEGRDLSPVTDKLWKNFYVRQFGVKSINLVVDRMKQKKVSFRWRQLYDAKKKDMEEAEQRSIDRIKQLYKNEDARKQSRQIQLCAKVPPSSCKRNFYGTGPNLGNTKSSLMKKAKLDFLNSNEVKNSKAMKRNVVQRNSVLPIRKPGSFCAKGSSSSSTTKFSKPTERRF